MYKVEGKKELEEKNFLKLIDKAKKE